MYNLYNIEATSHFEIKYLQILQQTFINKRVYVSAKFYLTYNQCLFLLY